MITEQTPTSMAHPPAVERPRLPAGPRVVLATIVLLATLIVASVGLQALLALLFADASYLVQALATAVVHLVVGGAMVGVTLLWARKIDGRRARDIGLRFTRRSLALLALGIGVSALATFPTGLALSALDATRPSPALNGPWWAVVLLTFTAGFALQGFPEELMFRGYILSTLGERPLVAVAVSTVLFGLPHLLSGGGQQSAFERVLYLALPVGFGFAAAALGLLTRSLWPGVGIHAGYHFLQPLAVQAGIGGGPAIWIANGIVFAAVGVLALVWWSRRGRGAVDLVN